MTSLRKAKTRLTKVPSQTFPLIGAALLLALPWLGVSDTWTRQLILIAILALVVSGLNLTWGYAGELSFAQVATYALGAYVGGILTKHNIDLGVTMIVVIVASAVFGLLVGSIGLRLAGWGLAMVSFFVVLLLPDLTQIFERQTGGLIGLVGVPQPRLFGALLEPRGYYLLVIGCLIVWLATMRNIVTSRQGCVLRIVRESPALATSLGLSVTSVKLKTYALGSVPAGVAGCLFVLLDSFIAPDYFGLDLSIAILAAAVLGGAESVYGAVLGAAVLQLGPMRITGFERYSYVAYGAFLLLGGVFLSGGIAGQVGRFVRRTPKRLMPSTQVRTEADEALQAIPGETLEISGVAKDFGGIRALKGIDLVARSGTVTGLIGANGSGKTTLLNVISGFYTPSAGTVRLGGRDLSGGSPETRARHGVARTFQTPIMPRGVSVVQGVGAARFVQARASITGMALRLPHYRRTRIADRAVALKALDVLGISHLADAPASSLPLGSRRLVEVARAMVAMPAVLLLDEPASGLDQSEVDQLARVVRRLADAGATVVVVEHNFRFICETADQVYVLESGSVLSSGAPAQVRVDQRVISSYLGELAGAEQ